jgi:hypothetical protein
MNVPENTTPVAKLRSTVWPPSKYGADHLDSVSVDSFTLVVVGGLGALVLVLWLLGRYYPGSGLEQLGLQSGRELAERREELEAEDLDQMLRAHNARKRARGEAEVTAEEYEARLLRERREQG